MESRARHGAGIVLGVIQFIFTLTWTVYVIFLPSLATQSGIPRRWVVFILLADQVVFSVMDYAMGVAADQVARVFGRLGRMILAVTLLSCLAFLLLPYAAPEGVPALLLILIVLWALTSSALRAPPFVLLAKYSPGPAVPWLSALSLFGLGLAGAISPYLTITLRDVDPRLPFVAASVGLALATVGIIWAERKLGNDAPADTTQSRSSATNPRALWFFAAMLLVGLGFQIHFSLNAAKLDQHFVRPDELQYLMPVFWIGFNVLMLPATAATRRYGGLAIAAAGALVAAVASLGAVMANDLKSLVVFQFVAGGGWGFVLMSAITAAIALGHTGREGKLTGGLFALLAVAAFLRIGVLATHLNENPAMAALLTWTPVIAWSAGGIILLCLVGARRKIPAPAAA